MPFHGFALNIPSGGTRASIDAIVSKYPRISLATLTSLVEIDLRGSSGLRLSTAQSSCAALLEQDESEVLHLS